MASGNTLFVVGGLGRLVRHQRVNAFVFILALSILSFYFLFLSKNSLWVTRNLPTLSHVKSFPGSVIADKPDRLKNDHLVVSPKESKKPDQENVKDIDEVMDACKYPILDPFDPSIMSLSKFNPPINCERGNPNLVYMIDKTIKVNQSRTALLNSSTRAFKNCVYKSVDREPGSDMKTVVLYTSEPFQYGITPRVGDDNLVVECFDTNHSVISRSYFSLIRIKADLELELEDKFKKHLAVNSPKEVLNVLMIGLDGNSKQNLERHMPKTRNFLLNDLKALELHKYNKVYEATYANLISLLTGKSWRELESDNWTYNDYFDFVNEHFLWSKFRQVGYRTGAYFDETVGTPFHVPKKGWKKSPVDYYLRAIIIERNRDTLMKGKNPQCIGDIPVIASDNDFWVQMASTFNNSKTQPYFGFSFCTELTHNDNNMASAGDNLYLKFFQEMRDKNLLHNTVIVFFSDHGQRFGATRTTKTYLSFPKSATNWLCYYEATLKYHNTEKNVEMIGDINRINMYRGQAECVGVAKLMPYCFCKK